MYPVDAVNRISAVGGLALGEDFDGNALHLFAKAGCDVSNQSGLSG